jgi:adenylosuccinate lyase
MARVAEESSQLICSEALLYALAKQIGKPRAFSIMYDLSQGPERANLYTAAKSHPEIGAALSHDLFEQAFDPRRHLGAAGEFVDKVVARARVTLGPSERS